MLTHSADKTRTLSTWLYQYWYSAFVAAQSWSRSPAPKKEHLPETVSPRAADISSTINDLGVDLIAGTEVDLNEQREPSHECNWLVHMTEEAFKKIFVPPKYTFESEDDMAQRGQLFSSSLHESLGSNNFSTITEDHLPIPVPEIARRLVPQPDDFVQESVAYAIMGRNCGLLKRVLATAKQQRVDIAPIYPFHMAAAFLDGGTRCCKVLHCLIDRVSSTAVTKARFTNEYGHTILDSLLLTILKSHSTVNMNDVDATLTDSAIIPGQEVDVCGRWSADSLCFRGLVANGETTIPASWKHKFCHTSIQAVTHLIANLLFEYPTMIDLPSGLFQHVCFDCGHPLQLGPLHALVMTAFGLATVGRPGEDLFGILACYLCLVANGVSPLNRCTVSVSRLLNLTSETLCSHQEMSPYETAMFIENQTQTYMWPESIRVGWRVFIQIMRVTEGARVALNEAGHEKRDGHGRTAPDNMELDSGLWTDVDTGIVSGWVDDSSVENGQPFSNCSGPRHSCDYIVDASCVPCFGESVILGHVWAAVQAELASYRRVTKLNSWTSELFSMESLLESLVRGRFPDLGYLKCNMLRPYCTCGNFKSAKNRIALYEEIFIEHQTNHLLDESTEDRLHISRRKSTLST